MRSRTILLALLTCLLPGLLAAQTMTGVVVDGVTGKPMPYVSYENIFTHAGGTTDSSGRVSVPVAGGQLVEFHKMGYEKARVRIPMGTLPPFFKIALTESTTELPEVWVYDRYRNYRNDSLGRYETYKNAINYQKLSGAGMIQHPFTAMSRHYQSIMRFQKEYAYLEQMRYVDYAFNENIIRNLTGLSGDSVQRYMNTYRPTYEQLRNMSEYARFAYIRQTVNAWRQRLRGEGSRGGGF